MSEGTTTIGDASRAALAATEEGGVTGPGETPAETAPEETAPAETTPEEGGGETTPTEGEAPSEGAGGETTAPEAGAAVETQQMLIDGAVYDVTPEERDQYIAFLGQKAYREALEAGNKPAPEAAPAEGEAAEPTTESRIASLEQQLRDAHLRTTQKELVDGLASAISSDKFLKDHPLLSDAARRSAMAAIHANPRLAEKTAVTAVTRELKKAFDADRKAHLNKKVKAALGGEGGSGGATVTPAPKKLSGKDFLKGRVAQAAEEATRGMTFG